MSEVLEKPEIKKEMPPCRGASLADINGVGAWLIPRLCGLWAARHEYVSAYLRSALSSNEQRLVACGDAIGMAHVEPGKVGYAPRVAIDFVLSEHLTDGVDECVEIFAWFKHWGESMGACGLFRVDDYTDADRWALRARFGKLTKHESYNVMFEERDQ